jgi:hypothetical protein
MLAIIVTARMTNRKPSHPIRLRIILLTWGDVITAFFP